MDIKKIFGNENERLLKKYKPLVQKINDLEPTIKKLKDEDFLLETVKLKERLKNGETLEDISNKYNISLIKILWWIPSI